MKAVLPIVVALLPAIAQADDLQTDMIDSLDRAANRLAESPGKVDGYKPENPASILDTKTDAVALLKGLPYVADVRSVFKAGQPKRRIIVFQNLHTTDRETFVADVEHERGRKITEREAILEYWYLLSEVETIQAEQMAALRCLVRHHGLTEAYQEGVATGELAAVHVALIASNVRAVNKLPGDWQTINADHLKLLRAHEADG